MIAKDELPAISDPENTLVIKLKSGLVVVDLNDEGAPQHAGRLKELARAGFYDGIVFHRVIDGFMAQTGDPTGTGRGGSDKPDLPAEFGPIPFERGVVGMARSQSPNSANSQFFITFQNSDWLNGQYTVVGTVVSGMEHVDQIKRGEGSGGVVSEPRDEMLAVRVAADL
ncbi:MAG: peptidylprolyl isomerase [Pseudomonadota bacterium]